MEFCAAGAGAERGVGLGPDIIPIANESDNMIEERRSLHSGIGLCTS